MSELLSREQMNIGVGSGSVNGLENGGVSGLESAVEAGFFDKVSGKLKKVGALGLTMVMLMGMSGCNAGSNEDIIVSSAGIEMDEQLSDDSSIEDGPGTDMINIAFGERIPAYRVLGLVSNIIEESPILHDLGEQDKERILNLESMDLDTFFSQDFDDQFMFAKFLYETIWPEYEYLRYDAYDESCFNVRRVEEVGGAEDIIDRLDYIESLYALSFSECFESDEGGFELKYDKDLALKLLPFFTYTTDKAVESYEKFIPQYLSAGGYRELQKEIVDVSEGQNGEMIIDTISLPYYNSDGIMIVSGEERVIRHMFEEYVYDNKTYWLRSDYSFLR